MHGKVANILIILLEDSVLQASAKHAQDPVGLTAQVSQSLDGVPADIRIGVLKEWNQTPYRASQRRGDAIPSYGRRLALKGTVMPKRFQPVRNRRKLRGSVETVFKRFCHVRLLSERSIVIKSHFAYKRPQHEVSDCAEEPIRSRPEAMSFIITRCHALHQPRMNVRI